MFTSELSSDCSFLSEHIAGPSPSTPKFPCPPLEEISSQDASKNAVAKIAASMEVQFSDDPSVTWNKHQLFGQESELGTFSRTPGILELRGEKQQSSEE
ncbi:hypothetical protein AVEN_154701-1 [Araneus ventricosus]|uniref:Uncharacterized protein n=1 Tax=Araneus ventricosus TaxID=182803 RepID=A0A4Y2PFI4_ARAVE|nr:hypothetical protein AVEN_154701-1 [Araneus ventricosus]